MRRLLIGLWILAGAAHADSTGAGSTGTQFLKLPLGGRPAGMGDAYVAVASGADSVLWNPAGMDQLRDLQANVGHLAYLTGITDDYLEVARPIYGLGAWGFGANYLYAQDQGYDNFGNPTAGFTDYDLSIQGALSLELMEDLHIGGVYKIIDEDYAHQHSMGSGFDLGLQWRNLWKRVDLGATVDNFGTPIALGGDFALLPLQFKLGTALHLTDDWLLAADYEYQPFDYFVSWHFGTEYGYKIGPLQTYARVGYTLGPVQDQGTNAGLGAGLGIGLGAWELDYAYTPQGDLGTTQRLSVTWSSWLF